MPRYSATLGNNTGTYWLNNGTITNSAGCNSFATGMSGNVLTVGNDTNLTWKPQPSVYYSAKDLVN